jgi:hypothetical protein
MLIRIKNGAVHTGKRLMGTKFGILFTELKELFMRALLITRYSVIHMIALLESLDGTVNTDGLSIRLKVQNLISVIGVPLKNGIGAKLESGLLNAGPLFFPFL